MTRKPVATLMFSVAMLALIAAGALAQGGPPPDAEPGSVGFQSAILGGIDPVVAPGYRLVLAEVALDPGAYATSHTHPTAIVVCVQSGALGFALQHGQATITRSSGAGTPAPTEPLMAGSETVLNPRDCVAFDHFAVHTAHTGWNTSDGQTILWEARLVKADEPYTNFLDAAGTPVA